MAQYDLTHDVAPFMDRHLVFPLLEFLQEKKIYTSEQILKAKIELLGKTNMVDYMMDIYKSLYGTEDVPQDMVDRRVEVVTRLKNLEEQAAPIISLLQSPNIANELRQEKQVNLQMLQERYQIGPEQIEALYQFAKFQFDCGNYSAASDFLYQYRTLSMNTERNFSAMWGKLAAEILMQTWAVAENELSKLKEIIDSKNASTLVQLQNRTWLMHWSLFVYFNLETGRNSLIDLFTNDRYLNVIQTHARHLLRYLSAAVIMTSKRGKQRNALKELIKVIQQEHFTYRDPITEFLECLYVNYDFEGAQQKLQECDNLITNDFFLGKFDEKSGSYVFRDEFMENARLFLFETYCRIHQCIDIGMLSNKLNKTYDDAERWIANLISIAKLDAKIDSKNGTIVMGVQHTDIYEQIIDRTKHLTNKTFMLVRGITEGDAAA